MAITNSTLLQKDPAHSFLGQAKRRFKTKKVNFEAINEDSDSSDNELIPKREQNSRFSKLDKKPSLRKRYFTRGLSFSHCDAAPYGSKIYLARRKLPDPWYVILMEVIVIILVVCFAVYCFYFLENVIFHVERFYAHVGHSHAQHQTGQRYLHGAGTDQNHSMAAEYFKMAAEQGHPHAKFNLAVGHLKGHHSMLEPGEPRAILEDAIMDGIPEAQKILDKFCNRGNKC